MAASSRPTATGSQVWCAMRGVRPSLRRRSAPMRSSTSAATACASTFDGRRRLGRPLAADLVGAERQQAAAVPRATGVGRNPPRGVAPARRRRARAPSASATSVMAGHVTSTTRSGLTRRIPSAWMTAQGRTTKSQSSTRASTTVEMRVQLRGAVSRAGTSRASPARPPRTPTTTDGPGTQGPRVAQLRLGHVGLGGCVGGRLGHVGAHGQTLSRVTARLDQVDRLRW